MTFYTGSVEWTAMKITLNKGGTLEDTVELKDIVVPDCWPIASNLANPKAFETVNKTWHLCHDLLRTLREIEAATAKPKKSRR